MTFMTKGSSAYWFWGLSHEGEEEFEANLDVFNIQAPTAGSRAAGSSSSRS
jgi:hypothetical protein